MTFWKFKLILPVLASSECSATTRSDAALACAFGWRSHSPKHRQSYKLWKRL